MPSNGAQEKTGRVLRSNAAASQWKLQSAGLIDTGTVDTAKKVMSTCSKKRMTPQARPQSTDSNPIDVEMGSGGADDEQGNDGEGVGKGVDRTDPVVENIVARDGVDSDGDGDGSRTTVSPCLLFSAEADSTTQATLHTLSPGPRGSQSQAVTKKHEGKSSVFDLESASSKAVVLEPNATPDDSGTSGSDYEETQKAAIAKRKELASHGRPVSDTEADDASVDRDLETDSDASSVRRC